MKKGKNIIHTFLRSRIHHEENLDDPLTIVRHRQHIHSKRYLKNIYQEFYSIFKKESGISKNKKGIYLEIGSGGGFLKDVIPQVVTSDILPLSWVDKHISAFELPYGKKSIEAIFMFNVLHHLSDPKKFFREANRCFKVGGKLIMIEPANTLFGRFIYQNFHHELFNPHSSWGFHSYGPMSSANGAIPWIIFFRDRKKYEAEFSELTIKKIEFHTPFRYLLSGGVSFPQLLPSWTYSCINAFEKFTRPLHPLIGMYMTIVVEKRQVPT